MIFLALLEEHAKVLEGWRPGMQSANDIAPAHREAVPAPQPQFDTVFRSPVQATYPFSTQSESTPEKTHARDSIQSATKVTASQPTPPIKSAMKPGKSTIASVPTPNAKAGPSQPKTPAAPPQTIQDILNSFMENQESLAKATGKSGMPNGSANDVVSDLRCLTWTRADDDR